MRLRWIVLVIGLLVAALGCCAAPAVVMVSLGSAARPPAGPVKVAGIPARVLDAYRDAAEVARREGCRGMRWQVLAGIGMVESRHAQGREVTESGDVRPRIIGPQLNGGGAGGNTTPIRDSDDGRWDGDTDFDRAVGPMQFLPSTWEGSGRDGNRDGRRDPHNIGDAAQAAAAYLCASGSDLSSRDNLARAVRTYNRSDSYVTRVLGLIDSYDRATEAAPAGAAGGSSSRGRRVIAAAKRWLGTPYQWGGTCTDPDTAAGRCDCSSLTQYAYRQAGVTITRTTYTQWEEGHHIPRGRLAPGDLVFFDSDPSVSGPDHVGINIDGDQMIHAPQTGDVVKISRFGSRDDYLGARRPV